MCILRVYLVTLWGHGVFYVVNEYHLDSHGCFIGLHGHIMGDLENFSRIR